MGTNRGRLIFNSALTTVIRQDQLRRNFRFTGTIPEIRDRQETGT